jgi:hypothetical protein
MKRKGYGSIKDFQGKLKTATKAKGNAVDNQLAAGGGGLRNTVLHALVVILSVLVVLLLNVIDYSKLERHLRFFGSQSH